MRMIIVQWSVMWMMVQIESNWRQIVQYSFCPSMTKFDRNQLFAEREMGKQGNSSFINI